MTTVEFKNPKTGRMVTARAWRIVPREVCAMFKDGRFKTARDLSYAMLNDDDSISDMEEEQYGDCAAQNFALSTFENALDWRLGLAAVRFIEACIDKYRKYPMPFHVLATHSGDVFVQSSVGNLYAN